MGQNVSPKLGQKVKSGRMIRHKINSLYGYEHGKSKFTGQ